MSDSDTIRSLGTGSDSAGGALGSGSGPCRPCLTRELEEPFAVAPANHIGDVIEVRRDLRSVTLGELGPRLGQHVARGLSPHPGDGPHVCEDRFVDPDDGRAHRAPFIDSLGVALSSSTVTLLRRSVDPSLLEVDRSIWRCQRVALPSLPRVDELPGHLVSLSGIYVEVQRQRSHLRQEQASDELSLLEAKIEVRETFVRGRFTTPKSRASRRVVELGPRTLAVLAEQ